ncbi:MAG: hypothetical protein KFB95_09060 [Simkaniaceae bacterium]|nr:MAG: hypothetical protein KFB95_09060 [Simkaniaceae bacterium]
MSYSLRVGSKPYVQAAPQNGAAYQSFPSEHPDAIVEMGGLSQCDSMEYTPTKPSSPERTPQHRSSINWVAVGKTAVPICLGIATIGLLAVSIINRNGVVFNAWINVALGVTFQATLQVVPFRKNAGQITLYGRTLKYEKDKIVKYSSIFFIAFTQLYLNLKQPKWFVRMTYGTMNFILGMLVATKVDNIINWRLEDSHIPESLEARPLVTNERAALHSPALDYSRTITVIPIDKKAMNAEAMEDFKRRGLEGVKFLVAAVIVGSLLAARHFNPSEKFHKASAFPMILSYIFLGHAIGGLFHEIVHAIHKRLRKKHQEGMEYTGYGNPEIHTPRSLQILIAIEKIERVCGILLPGFIIAFNTVPGALAAGALMGIMRQIDLIEFTQTHITQHHRLEREAPRLFTTARKIWEYAKLGFAWTFAVVATGAWVGYNIYTLGTAPYNLYPLITFPIVLFPAYFIARKIDSQQIDENSPPWLNFLFFVTHYSISACIVYIAASLTLNLNDVALKSYPTYATLVACMGIASIALAFAFQAALRATNRKVTFPAEIDPLIILFTYFFAQQLLGLA